MFYQLLLKRRSYLQKKINDLKSEIKKYPDGHLIITHNGSYSKWYKSDGKTSTYIPKKEKGSASALALKKYASCLLEEYSHELTHIDSFLEKYKELPPKSDSLLNDEAFLYLFTEHHSFFASDIHKSTSDIPKWSTDVQKWSADAPKWPVDAQSWPVDAQSWPVDVQKWSAEEYDKSTKYPEQLQHKCLSGEKVRSKSEVIIANTLFIHHIPYRYECALSLDGITFYPDFTILNPTTCQPIYWEHFGLMDVPSYCDQAFNKLKQFSYHGIIPTINLITTYETRQTPIDSEQIENIVLNILGDLRP